MSQLEETTEAESEVGHFQFSILSLMILTAAVGGFIAVDNQAPGLLGCYILVVCGIGSFPKYRRSIFAAFLCIFYGVVSDGFEKDYFSEGNLLLTFEEARLLTVLFLSCLAAAIYAIFSTNRFDRGCGIVCVFWSLYFGFYDFIQILVMNSHR